MTKPIIITFMICASAVLISQQRERTKVDIEIVRRGLQTEILKHLEEHPDCPSIEIIPKFDLKKDSMVKKNKL